LKTGIAGMVYFLEAGPGGGGRGGAGAGATLHRYSLRDHRDVPFVTGAADFDVSLDGHKLVYRGGGGGGGGGPRPGGAPRGGGGGGGGRTAALPRRRRPQPAAGGPGPRERRPARVRRPEAGVQADLQRGVAQPA